MTAEKMWSDWLTRSTRTQSGAEPWRKGQKFRIGVRDEKIWGIDKN